MAEIKTVSAVVTIEETRFGNDYIPELMVDTIKRGIVFVPRCKSTKMHQNSIITSMGAIAIFTIVRGKKLFNGMG